MPEEKMGYFSRKAKEELDEYEAERRIYDAAPPHEKTNIRLRQTMTPVVTELRMIKWILYAMLIIALCYLEIRTPGWWKPSWW